MLAVAALAAAACSSGSGGSGSASTSATSSGSGSGTSGPTTSPGTIVPAPAGFRAATVTVRLADGTTVTRCVLVADTAELREQGLMGVTDPQLDGYDGMLFVFSGDLTGGFWMKDTLVPLSIAFVEASGAVVSTADMVPCPAGTKQCPVTRATAPYRYAVEVPSGALADMGLTEGASLDPTLGPACRPQAASGATG